MTPKRCTLSSRLTRGFVVASLVAGFWAATRSAGDEFEEPAPVRQAVAFTTVIDNVRVVGTLVSESPANDGFEGAAAVHVLHVGINDAAFDKLVYGPQFTAGGARARLKVLLALKIAAMDSACGLTDRQKRKLELAGHGDIAQLFHRVDEQRPKLEQIRIDDPQTAGEKFIKWSREVALEIQPLRDAFKSGPFGDGSLFSRIRKRFLSADQQALCALVDRIDRLAGKISARARDGGADSLTEIRLSAATIDEETLACLSQATPLGSLLLDDSTITDAGTARLKELKNLEILDLRNTRITDAGLESIAGLTNLRSLRLDGTKVTDAGLVYLKPLCRLEYLHLGNTRITGAGLAHLQGLTNLQDFYLGDTRVEDAALPHLRGLSALEHLSLSDTRITSAGLTHLSGLSRLQRLFLIGTDVTAASAAELNRSLPRLTIIR
jgi:hypothetical protein